MNRKTLGKTGWTVSSCGFGSYRIDDRIDEHENALKLALRSGVNLIDTSANYSDGHSEILIGRVLKDLIDEGSVKREELVLVTKGGYIQGSNLEAAADRERNGNPFPEAVKCSPDLWHSIHPEFLEDQITNSLERMGVERIDVYLLHNPEYFLTYSLIEDKADLRREYYGRIKRAFEYLESEADRGRILFYGVSSNAFGNFPEQRDFTSIEKMIGISEEISPRNRFAVAQIPINLLEKGGYNNKNQGDYTKSFLEAAAENGIGVLGNRPLNAIAGNKLVRLADYRIKEDVSEVEFNELIGTLEVLENEILENHTARLEDIEAKEVAEYLSTASTIRSHYSGIESVNHFIEIRRQYLVPRINHAINKIYESRKEDPAVTRLLNSYAMQANVTFDSLESLLAKEKNRSNEVWHNRLSGFFPEGSKPRTLSAKAIHMISSIGAVSSVLVGMRKLEYVREVLETMKLPLSEDAGSFWMEE